ncbi:unnamed protein product [Parajaminaea phylloscopi]
MVDTLSGETTAETETWNGVLRYDSATDVLSYKLSSQRQDVDPSSLPLYRARASRLVDLPAGLRGCSDALAELVQRLTPTLSIGTKSINLCKGYERKLLRAARHQLLQVVAAISKASQNEALAESTPRRSTGHFQVDWWYAALACLEGSRCTLLRPRDRADLRVYSTMLDEQGDVKHNWCTEGTLSGETTAETETWNGVLRYDAAKDVLMYNVAPSSLPMATWHETARHGGSTRAHEIKAGLRQYLDLSATDVAGGRLQCGECGQICATKASLDLHVRGAMPLLRR